MHFILFCAATEVPGTARVQVLPCFGDLSPPASRLADLEQQLL